MWKENEDRSVPANAARGKPDWQDIKRRRVISRKKGTTKIVQPRPGAVCVCMYNIEAEEGTNV